MLQPRGSLPYRKDGSIRRKFWKELLRGTKVLLRRRGFFSPLRGNNSKTHIISCHICACIAGFSKNLRGGNDLRLEKTRKRLLRNKDPKRRHKSLHSGPFEDEHPKRYQNRFLTTTRFSEYPSPCYMEVSPGGLQRKFSSFDNFTTEFCLSSMLYEIHQVWIPPSSRKDKLSLVFIITLWARLLKTVSAIT